MLLSHAPEVGSSVQSFFDRGDYKSSWALYSGSMSWHVIVHLICYIADRLLCQIQHCILFQLIFFKCDTGNREFVDSAVRLFSLRSRDCRSGNWGKLREGTYKSVHFQKSWCSNEEDGRIGPSYSIISGLLRNDICQRFWFCMNIFGETKSKTLFGRLIISTCFSLCKARAFIYRILLYLKSRIAT